MGVATGCGCKEVYRFPHTILIPTPLVSVLFYSSIPTFCSFFVVFVFLLNVFIRLHLLLNDLVFHCIHIKYIILKYILINN